LSYLYNFNINDFKDIENSGATEPSENISMTSDPGDENDFDASMAYVVRDEPNAKPFFKVIL
jgi:hypothetical protein